MTIFFANLIEILLLIISIALVLLILIQKGRGGGLVGALGGAGGTSAFGARAGDTFTRITLIAAGIWMGLIVILIFLTQPDPRPRGDSVNAPPPVATSPATPDPVIPTPIN